MLVGYRLFRSRLCQVHGTFRQIRRLSLARFVGYGILGACGKAAQAAARRVLVVVVPPVDELDLVGPLQVFSAVNRHAGRPVYAIENRRHRRKSASSRRGGVLTFLAHRHLQDVTQEYDSVLLVCGLASRHARDAALFPWLKHARNRLRRLGAVCVGVFLLAEAGLLSGRRVTSHWRFASELGKRYPASRSPRHSFG